ncbi:YciI family protein [Sphingomonas brevis]|uniref:YciI family protein n=1 Tax=Sphingomonas brevis TaxID=2908206 RepID=UPI003D69F9C4
MAGPTVKCLVMMIRTPAFDPRVIPAHLCFLDDLRERGMLEQSGPFTDGTGGAYVLKVRSYNQALFVAEQDPLNLQDCSTITVREWKSGP